MNKYIIGLFIIVAAVIPKTVAADSSHPIGTNIVDSHGTVYRITVKYTAGGDSTMYRTPYTSAGAFRSYKFNSWAAVVPASSADLALPLDSRFDGNHWYDSYISPRPGSLINDKGTVYLITANAKRGFTSEKVFKDLGYSYNYVYPGDTSFLLTQQPIASSTEVHPQGTLINNNGTLYIMHIQGRIGVPSMAVLESWGYWANDAVKANSADISLNEVAVLTLRESTEFDLFFKFQ